MNLVKHITDALKLVVLFAAIALVFWTMPGPM